MSSEDQPQSFTAEHRSFEWELVLQYEDGSLPLAQFNEPTLGVVAGWYAKTVPADQARTRYEQGYQRNRRRLVNRLGNSHDNTAQAEALDAIWSGILEQRLAARA